MVNYGKGIIYKLCSKDPNITECYVGSTCSFARRKSQHKNTCNTENGKQYTLNLYVFIRETGGWDNWDMIQIEQYEAKDKRDLETRERYHIEMLKSQLNSKIPGRSHKEYRTDNIDKIKAHKKMYYIENAEKINEKSKIYRTENIEKIRQQEKEYYIENSDDIKKKRRLYRSENLEKVRQQEKEYWKKNPEKKKARDAKYYADNAEKISEKGKEYRAKNADKIKERHSTLFHCDICDADIQTVNKSRHFRTTKHINNTKK